MARKTSSPRSAAPAAPDNPLYDENPRQTMQAVAAVLDFLAAITPHEGVILGDEAKYGYCMILHTCRQALSAHADAQPAQG